MPTDIRPTVVIVGESPPPKAPPGFVPFDCDSGTRLATKAIGLLSRVPLLAHVPRVNVFDEPGMGILPGKTWDAKLARGSANIVARKYPSGPTTPTTFVAMGNKVKAAFGLKDLPAYSWAPHNLVGHDFHVVACPHPSGQNTSLNIASVQAITRRLLIPELVAGCSGLSTWYWNLDDKAVLADLGAALCPNDPVLGVAAAVLSNEVMRTWLSSKSNENPLPMNVKMPLLDLMQAAHDGPDRVLDLWQVEGGKRRDLRARMKAVKSSGIVDNYPPEVLRATMGRYVALGVL